MRALRAHEDQRNLYHKRKCSGIAQWLVTSTRRDQRGSNFTSIGSRVSVLAGCHLHLRMAFSAACANTGCPPLTSTDLTLPLGKTNASTLTVPRKFIVRASSGYCGTTRLTTLRMVSGGSCCSCWANEELGVRTTAQKKTSNAAVVVRLMGLDIDTRRLLVT